MTDVNQVIEKKSRIHIEAGKDGVRITIDDVVFLARSIWIEPAPCQDGSIIWMVGAKPEIGMLPRKDFVSLYMDKDGEPVGEELVTYIAQRYAELNMN